MPNQKTLAAVQVEKTYIWTALYGEHFVETKKVGATKVRGDWAVHGDDPFIETYTVTHVPSGMALITRMPLVTALDILEKLPLRPSGYPTQIPKTMDEARRMLDSNSKQPDSKRIIEIVREARGIKVPV